MVSIVSSLRPRTAQEIGSMPDGFETISTPWLRRNLTMSVRPQYAAPQRGEYYVEPLRSRPVVAKCRIVLRGQFSVAGLLNLSSSGCLDETAWW